MRECPELVFGSTNHGLSITNNVDQCCGHRTLDRFLLNNRVMERLAIGINVVVIACWLVFWTIQVIGVIELLKLAYG